MTKCNYNHSNEQNRTSNNDANTDQNPSGLEATSAGSRVNTGPGDNKDLAGLSIRSDSKSSNTEVPDPISAIPESQNVLNDNERPAKQPVSPVALPEGMFGMAASMVSVTSDMFAPENLRISQDFVEQAETESIQGAISVGKPGKQMFCRVRPGDEWQLLAAVIEEEEAMEKTLWIVPPALIPELKDEVSHVLLRLAVNRLGVPFLWPLKISRDGKSNLWNQSAMRAADAATRNWVRMRGNGRQYEIITAKNDSTEPIWPDMSFQKILELALKDRIITDRNHPLLRQLRGEA